jgi:hypothetical protein
MEPTTPTPQPSSQPIVIKTTSGLAIASLILGIISFIPLLGVLPALVAIILGTIGLVKIKNNHNLQGKGMAIAGIVLGSLGILLTILIYSALFYFVFKATDGPFTEVKVEASQQILTQNAGALELYNKKFGRYPGSLEVASKAGYMIFPMDHYLKPLFYEVSQDGKSYVLKSPGPDGLPNTADDILPKQ